MDVMALKTSVTRTHLPHQGRPRVVSQRLSYHTHDTTPSREAMAESPRRYRARLLDELQAMFLKPKGASVRGQDMVEGAAAGTVAARCRCEQCSATKAQSPASAALPVPVSGGRFFRRPKGGDFTLPFLLEEIPGLLSPDECQQLICGVEESWEASRVSNEGGSPFVSTSRTSSTAWANESSSGQSGDIVRKLLQRAKQRCPQLLDLWGHADKDVQLVRYLVGQRFKSHSDTSYRNGVPRSRATLLVYLNSNFVGGETRFPKLDAQVKPEVGKGVLWFTFIGPDGKPDEWSRHEAMPITSGTKYAVTQWFSLPAAGAAVDTQSG